MVVAEGFFFFLDKKKGKIQHRTLLMTCGEHAKQQIHQWIKVIPTKNRSQFHINRTTLPQVVRFFSAGKSNPASGGLLSFRV